LFLILLEDSQPCPKNEVSEVVFPAHYNQDCWLLYVGSISTKATDLHQIFL
jgi:hypothetical protein